MKLLSKIRALFTFESEAREMNVSAAEIRGNRVFLHPVDDPKHTFCMKATHVDILIDPAGEINQNNIMVINRKKGPDSRNGKPTKSDASGNKRAAHTYYMPPMKVVSVRLYPEEYEMLMENLRATGYRKTEYLLACVAAAKKNSLDAAYKQFFADHKERRKAAREAAKQSKQATE